MKLFKSLLLGSAAGLVVVSGASAADLGVKKPVAVEYVKICSAHGAGFFYIPGSSDTCMQIGGFIRTEYLYTQTRTRGDDVPSFRGYGRITVDTRQTTSYGLLRTFIRYDALASGGAFSANGAVGSNLGVNAYATPNNTNALLNRAFIQFYTGTAGYFMAGRMVSAFDFYANDLSFTHVSGSDRSNVNLLSYTATFGKGFSATLSVEDQWLGRRQAGAGLATVAGLTYSGAAGTAQAQAGQSLPDIVGSLAVTQPWGSAQLSGAVHQLRLSNRDLTGNYVATTYGYAVQGGVKLNLPMIAAGDVLWLQAAYGNGAIDFAGTSRNAVDVSSLGSPRAAAVVADAYIDSLGNVKKSNAWTVVAALQHNFTPDWQMMLYGSYGKVSYSGTGANRIGTLAGSAFNGSRAGYVDYTVAALGGRLTWFYAKNFYIGQEVQYTLLDLRGRVSNPYDTPAAATGTKGSFGTWSARLRFHRGF